jgi:ArsR family metal-binding transcriptional regulator
MDRLIENYAVKIVEPGCSPGSGRYGLHIDLKEDISAVLPYLNAQIKDGSYDHGNHHLIWREPQQAYSFHPREIKIARLEDTFKANQVAGELISKVNQVWQNRQNISPCFDERRLATTIDLFKLLPKTNCKQCGFPTCIVFADALRNGQVQLEDCRLLSESRYAQSKLALQSILPSV